MRAPGGTRPATAGHRSGPRRLFRHARWLLPLAVAGAAQAGPIYTCIDAAGRRLTADRPIAECLHREQYRLNRDGSVQAVIGPTPTADERAAIEAAEQRLSRDRAARIDAVRRDRNLLQRFPNEAVHRQVREAALAPLKQSVQVSQARIAALARERKSLLDEAEFYQGRLLPLALQQTLDANAAGLEAQQALAQNQLAEVARINALFDAELERLRRLWAGALPGSMGPLPTVSAQPQGGPGAARP